MKGFRPKRRRSWVTDFLPTPPRMGHQRPHYRASLPPRLRSGVVVCVPGCSRRGNAGTVGIVLLRPAMEVAICEAVLSIIPARVETTCPAEKRLNPHGGRVTVRDVTHGLRRFRGRADEAEAALGRLAAAGWGDWEEVPPDNRGGRPTRVFRLRHQCHRHQNLAKPEENEGFGDGDSGDALQTTSLEP